MTKRIFLACQIPQSAKSEIVHTQQHLKESKLALKLTLGEQLHITLAFLPRVKIGKLQQISQTTKKICSQFSRFTLYLANLDAFPNLKLPRIIYINLTGDTATLANLTKKIQHQLEVLGFEGKDERFLPHITIARTKSYVNKTERQKLGEAIQRWGKINPVKIEVGAVSVFESIPTSAGHVHNLLQKIELRQYQQNRIL